MVQRYTSELEIAFANALGVPVSDVNVVNFSEVDGNTFVQFEYVASSTATAALADLDTFTSNWQYQLSQIDGLNVLLGLGKK